MQNKIIGITGGVGSGKSVVLNYLKEKYQAVIIEADRLAEKLMEPGEMVYLAVVEAFSEEILDAETKKIDRKKMAEIVFHDSEKLEELNSIVHPLVKKAILQSISTWEKGGRKQPFVIEAALLIQDGYKKICDEIWYIHVSKEVRITRLISSRGYSREKCLSIMENQPGDEYFTENTNLTIENDGELAEVFKAIDRAVISG